MRLIIHERTKRTMFGLWCVTWLVVLVASLWPLQQMPFGLPDKLVHFACYAAMTSAAATFCHESARPAALVCLHDRHGWPDRGGPALRSDA